MMEVQLTLCIFLCCLSMVLISSDIKLKQCYYWFNCLFSTIQVINFLFQFKHKFKFYYYQSQSKLKLFLSLKIFICYLYPSSTKSTSKSKDEVQYISIQFEGKGKIDYWWMIESLMTNLYGTSKKPTGHKET